MDTSSSNSAPLRSRRRIIVAMIAVAAIPLSPLASSALASPRQESPSIQELQRQRDEVRREKAAKASSINVLEASDAEVRTALVALTANVGSQRDRVEEAERSVTQALADQVAAESAQVAKQAELDVVTAQIRESAVEAYVTTSSGGTFVGIGAADVNDTVKKKALVGMRASSEVDLAERFRSVQQDLELQRAAAETAAQAARDNQAAVEARLVELASAVEEQRAFADQVERRLDSALAEADALASLDEGLARSINEKQVEIARAIEAQRAEQAARAARDAASRASRVITHQPPPARPSSAPARSSSQPQGPSAPASSNTGGSPPPIVGGGEIVSVAGIRVHSSIAANLQALLAAASAAGIELSGGGYRDPAGQIAVRRNNCGTSNYAIYEMPASSCRPPTARPGSSMHERGLAIDFTQGGRTLTRSSPGFAWLRSNAARFGLKNLPVEPWHWSTNGN